MMLRVKLCLITIINFFGALFVVLFPPRNFQQSGATMRTIKTMSGESKYKLYVNHDMLLTICKQIANENEEIARMVRLTPITTNNRSLVSMELRSDKQSRKPGILIVGALNGMAWGAVNAVLELAERLLYDANFQTPFFNDYDWYLIPMGNPDGVHFTQKLRDLSPIDAEEWSKNLTARKGTRPVMWLKNVNKFKEQELCFGTNVDRNFAYHWQDDVHKTPEHCSQYYPGVKPFSTAEAQAIRAYIDRLADVIQLAIYLHASFVPKKEYILYPWCYSLRQPSNYRTLQDIGEYAARQSRLPDGRLYEVHQSSSDERVAGSLSDYIAGVVGVELAFIIKPYHQMYPNYTDHVILDTYVNKAVTAILSVVRGWRRSTKQNTLTFFGRDVEF